MIRLHVRRGLLGSDGVETFPIEHRAGITPRELAFAVEQHLPKTVAIEAALNGERLDDEGLDQALPDDCDLMLLPITSTGLEIGAMIVQAVVTAAVLFAVNYVVSILSPRQRPDGEGQDRGDESSPTYAWDGIQTNYGQGFPVPWVYGRHAVGGQVIYTDVSAQSNVVGVDDRLRIILALCEGPIARIGATTANVVDDLGAIVPVGGTPPATYSPLPSEIRINGNLLTNTNQQQQVWAISTTAWSRWGGNSFLQLPKIGDTVSFWDRFPGYSAIQHVLRGRGYVYNLRNGDPRELDIIVTQGAGGGVNDYIALGTNNPDFDSGPPAGWDINTDGHAQIAIAASALRLTEVPGARVWIRPGYLDQPALPGSVFPGSVTTYSPGQQLNEQDDQLVYTYNASDSVSLVTFVVVFPGGLFAQSPQGDLLPYTVNFAYEWRRVGTTTWNNPGAVPIQAITASTPQQYAATWSMPIGSTAAPVAGPLEIRLKRLTPSGGTLTVSSAIWRNLTIATPQTLTYPRVALLGLELSAGARFSGGLPECNVRIDGAQVRVWDATHGWSLPTWDVPSAPHNWMTYAPGRNPAWILLDFLLAPWGLGRWLYEADVDLPAFRRWSIFCDKDPAPATPWGEQAFTCDLVGDAPRPAWEYVLAICAAGRATPVYRNGKISVVYQYRDAHADSLVSVPAKTAVQLLTSGNCENVQVTWLPKANRATAYLFQYLNETQLYAQDVYPVEDGEGTLNDPANLQGEEYRPETVQAWGVTRPSQIYREGVFRHRATRLIRRELVFTTGPWALAAEVGDVIKFEHELLRPFGADVPTAMSVVKDGTATNQIEVDHIVVGATQVVVRDVNGVAQTRTITGIVISPGISRLTVSGASVTIKKGAAAVVGLVDKLVEEYEVVGITLQKDLKREVRCLQWVAALHDPIPPSAYDGAGVDGAESTPAGYLRQPAQDGEPEVESVRILPQRDASLSVTWAKPIARRQANVRVYVRDAAIGEWRSLGEHADDNVVVRGLAAGRSYIFAACLERVDGTYQLPEQATQTTYTVPEFGAFALPSVSNLTATDAGDCVVVRWDALGMRDVVGYEIRVGQDWAAGEVVYRGAENNAELRPAPYGGTLLVAARSVSGLYGTVASVTAPTWRPYPTAQQVALDDLAAAPAGTHSGTVYTGGRIELTSGTLAGTYTGPELNLTYQANGYWQVSSEAREIELDTVDDLSFAIDSGEALWRTLNGRPASPCSPGIDWQTTVDDLAVTLDDLPFSFLVHGNVGEPGSHTRAALETRYFASGSWSAWSTHRDTYRVASKLQARVRIFREDLGYSPSITRLRYSVSL